MALGVTLFALGDVAWELILAAGSTPDASWADLVYLSGYVALATGVATAPAPPRRTAATGRPDRRGPARHSRGGARRRVPDHPRLRAGSAAAARIITALYPLADTLLVAGVVWLLVTPGLSRRVTSTVAAGMGMTLVLDVLWAGASLAGNDGLGRVVDGLFPLSYVLLAAGVALGATTPITPDRERSPHRDAVGACRAARRRSGGRAADRGAGRRLQRSARARTGRHGHPRRGDARGPAVRAPGQRPEPHHRGALPRPQRDPRAVGPGSADGRLQPPGAAGPARRAGRWPRPRPPRCSRSTWTTSSRSTTGGATTPATSCSARSPSGSGPAPATATS